MAEYRQDKGLYTSNSIPITFLLHVCCFHVTTWQILKKNVMYKMMYECTDGVTFVWPSYALSYLTHCHFYACVLAMPFLHSSTFLRMFLILAIYCKAMLDWNVQ